MRFNVGDRVRVKSLDWYNENKDEFGNIDINEDFTFYADRSRYCGKVFTISEVFDNSYLVKEDNHEYYWADEMIEGFVEETKPKMVNLDDIIKWLREHDMTKYIGVIYSGVCSINFDKQGLIDAFCKAMEE